jgi:hypothetical protein
VASDGALSAKVPPRKRVSSPRPSARTRFCSKRGGVVSVHDRLSEIVARYGPHDVLTRFIRRPEQLGDSRDRVLASGLSYLARPQVRHIDGLPRLSSNSLSLDVRNNLALNIFWYSRLKWAGILAAFYPYIFLTIGIYSDSPKSSAANNATSGPVSSLEGFVVFMGALAVGVVPPLMTIRVIRSRMVSWKVSRELYFFLNPREDDAKRERRYQRSTFPIRDPLGYKRSYLARIAQDLSCAAKVFENGQGRDLRPHPVSTTLRAVSTRMRQFLASGHSLQKSIPQEFIDVLDMALVMVCQSESPEIYNISGSLSLRSTKMGLLPQPRGRFSEQDDCASDQRDFRPASRVL